MKLMMILGVILAGAFFTVVSAEKCQRRVCNFKLFRNRLIRRDLNHMISPVYCTHVIIYRAQVTDKQEIKLTEDDGLHEIYQILDIRRRNPHLKVILGVHNDAFSDFVKMYTTDQNRNKFIKNAISYLRGKTIDGIKIGVQTSEGGDKEKFTSLIKELAAAISSESEATKKQRLLLSVGIPSDKSFLDKYYDVLEISKHVDMLDLATYSFIELGKRMSVVNPQHHSPLYSNDKSSTKTIDFMCRYVAEKGVRKDKINVGLSFFVSIYLHGNSQTGVYTRDSLTSGYASHCEFSFMYKKYYKMEPEKGRAVDLYKYQDYYTDMRIFDDPDTIKEKVKYVTANNYGGVLLYSISDDDYVNACKKGRHSLSKAAYEICSQG